MSDFDPSEHISAFIDEQLQGEELSAFEAALAADPALVAEVAALRELVADLGAMPAVEAPSSFAEAVLARVAALPIPGTEAAAAALADEVTEPLDGVAESTTEMLPAATEQVGLITETGVAADIPKLALSAITGPGGLSALFESLVASMWVKVPVGAAVAAGLALSLSYVISPDSAGPPPAQFAAMDSSFEESASSVKAAGDDAVVALDPEQEGADDETGTGESDDFGDRKEDSLMERPVARMRSGSPAAPSKVRTSRRSSRKKKKSESLVGPDGVYEADWESEDGVVAADEAPAATGGDFDNEAEESAPEESAAEESVAEHSAAEEPQAGSVSMGLRASLSNTSDITMDGEPLEDNLDPAADRELLEESALAMASPRAEAEAVFGAGAAARRGEAPPAAVAAAPAPSSEPTAKTASDTAVETKSETMPQAGNRLKVASRARANRLVQDLSAVGVYDIQVTRNPGFFVLSLRVPAEDWDGLLTMLRDAGALKLPGGTTPSGEQQTVRLAVLW